MKFFISIVIYYATSTKISNASFEKMEIPILEWVQRLPLTIACKIYTHSKNIVGKDCFFTQA